MKQLDGTGMKRLHRDWRRRTVGRLGLVLDDVQGPFNVGAIIRTAAALRADDVWLAGRTPPPDDAKVGKTALGTHRYLSFHRAERTVGAIDAARQAGYQVVAIELADGAVALHELALGAATCVVVGHEDRGLSSTVLEACDVVAFLPLLGRVGSLNVATAASIACFEVRRQGWSSSSKGSETRQPANHPSPTVRP
ncbi:MAG: TrmH family RNA methyltransferase [Acidimicrobiales bacterium]